MAKREEYLLVDGYNIIFDWEKLKKIAAYSLEAARNKLINILSNYAGVVDEKIIIVFDAHKVEGGVGITFMENNITIVFTKEAETADSYIEKTTGQLARLHKIRVATSDGLEQIIILSHGAYRVSAREFQLEVNLVEKKIRKRLEERRPIKNNELMSNLDAETAAWLEKMRRGE